MGQEGVRLKNGIPLLPEELLLARDRGEVLFIVGAGASYPAPSLLPDFGGLVADIYAEIDPAMSDPMLDVRKPNGPRWDEVAALLTHQQRTELKFFARGEYDVVLGMLERRIDGDPSRESTVRKAARKVLERTTQPNSLHAALIRLGQRFGRTLLVTTNFDRLLSISAISTRYNATSFGLAQIPSPSRGADFSGILHIHGKLPFKKEAGSELILTDQDFGDAYLRRHTVTSFLYDAARIFHLVLVGYSANDSPVRYLLNAIAADERHFVDLKPRYAFVGCDPEDERTSIEWSSRGIIPIPYDRGIDGNHAALGETLTSWANIIPDRKNTAILKNQLKTIAALDPAATEGEIAKPLMRYLVLRSTVSERAEMASVFSSNGASLKWLSVLNQFIRDSKGA